MAEASQSYLARQPILNRARQVAGYELLFRCSSTAEHADVQDPVLATARVATNVLGSFGAESILGDRPGFLNVPVELLEGDFVESLPDGRFVIELPPVEEVSEGLIRRVSALEAAKVRLALDDYHRRDARSVLLDKVRYVKIDTLKTPPDELKKLVRGLRGKGVHVIATKVESPDQYERLLQLGFDLFQGFFFAKPVLVEGKRVDPDRSSLLELMTQLESDADMDEIEEFFKRRPALSVNLLRLVNGLEYARAQRIESVSQALMMVGRRGLVRWLNILLFAGDEKQSPPTPLFSTAATRGKTVELLDEALCLEQGTPPEPQRAFLTGMLSLVHVVLGMTPEQVMEEIRVDPAVEAAILRREGLLGRLLSLTEQLEVGGFDEASKILEDLDLEPSQLQEAQVAAYEWVHGLAPTGR
ncbi:MAG: EAL domain-containing protein [Proteobacteria bacterium]|nr:EAL domain-containing protein [Pseudomonadota bacterium]